MDVDEQSVSILSVLFKRGVAGRWMARIISVSLPLLVHNPCSLISPPLLRLLHLGIAGFPALAASLSLPPRGFLSNQPPARNVIIVLMVCFTP